VWAIGHWPHCSPTRRRKPNALIRKVLAEISDSATAEKVRIQYGGSVSRHTAELMKQPDIDGALVGWCGLVARDFAEIREDRRRALAAAQRRIYVTANLFAGQNLRGRK